MLVVSPHGGANVAIFANHSCDPNMVIVPVFGAHIQDAGYPDLAFFAKRDIMPGEELCWNYGLEYLENMTAKGHYCRCGADNCDHSLEALERQEREALDELDRRERRDRA